MLRLFETVTDLERDAEILRRRRYGVVEAVEGRLWQVRLRPFPKLVSAIDILLVGRWRHEILRQDRCLLFYNQPLWHPGFLAVTCLASGRGTRLATVCRALETLDRIAEIKRVDALLCDVANPRISAEILARWGWEPHCPSRWHRNYIKRFYGRYSTRADMAGAILAAGTTGRATLQ